VVIESVPCAQRVLVPGAEPGRDRKIGNLV
jgi:hypothetical protein